MKVKLECSSFAFSDIIDKVFLNLWPLLWKHIKKLVLDITLNDNFIIPLYG